MSRWLLAIALILRAGIAHAEVPVLHDAAALKTVIEQAGDNGHPVVVHFFAMWCDDCVREMPVIRAAAERAQAQGATVLFVSLDPPKRAAAVERFLRHHRINATTYLLDAPDPDPVTKAIDPQWSAALPATFLFEDGRRVASFLGPLHHAADLLKAIVRIDPSPRPTPSGPPGR